MKIKGNTKTSVDIRTDIEAEEAVAGAEAGIDGYADFGYYYLVAFGKGPCVDCLLLFFAEHVHLCQQTRQERATMHRSRVPVLQFPYSILFYVLCQTSHYPHEADIHIRFGIDKTFMVILFSILHDIEADCFGIFIDESSTHFLAHKQYALVVGKLKQIVKHPSDFI